MRAENELVQLDWDVGTLSAARDGVAGGEPECEPAVLEDAIVGFVAAELGPRDAVRRVSISDLGHGASTRAVRLFVDVDTPAGPAREFWRLEPTGADAGPRRLAERFRRPLSELHQPDGVRLVERLAQFGTVNVVEREWLPPTPAERRFLLYGRTADAQDTVAVLRWPWFPTDQQAARALGVNEASTARCSSASEPSTARAETNGRGRRSRFARWHPRNRCEAVLYASGAPKHAFCACTTRPGRLDGGADRRSRG
jgi:hypothetical protein